MGRRRALMYPHENRTNDRRHPQRESQQRTRVSPPTPAMTLNSESKYPTRRAYVVKVRADAKRDVLSGRCENLVTGQQRDFVSGKELLESIASDLLMTAHEGIAGFAAQMTECLHPFTGVMP